MTVRAAQQVCRFGWEPGAVQAACRALPENLRQTLLVLAGQIAEHEATASGMVLAKIIFCVGVV